MVTDPGGNFNRGNLVPAPRNFDHSHFLLLSPSSLLISLLCASVFAYYFLFFLWWILLVGSLCQHLLTITLMSCVSLFVSPLISLTCHGIMWFVCIVKLPVGVQLIWCFFEFFGLSFRFGVFIDVFLARWFAKESTFHTFCTNY